MSTTELNLEPVTPHRRKSATLSRLLQAALLTAILMPLGSVALEASIISTQSCSFYYFGGEDGCSGSTSSDTRTFFFDFGTFTLQLFGLTGSTDITVTNATLTQAEFAARNAIAPADCITIAAPGTNGADDTGCRQLLITASNPEVFTGWRQDTFWNYDTNLLFPNGDDPAGPEPGQVRVYRGEGDLTASFTEDMCLAALTNSNYTPCEYFPAPSPIDPGIRSGDTDFSVITFTHVAPVPEPGTLLLLGTGLSGVVLRRRNRRKKSADAPAA